MKKEKKSRRKKKWKMRKFVKQTKKFSCFMNHIDFLGEEKSFISSKLKANFN